MEYGLIIGLIAVIITGAIFVRSKTLPALGRVLECLGILTLICFAMMYVSIIFAMGGRGVYVVMTFITAAAAAVISVLAVYGKLRGKHLAVSFIVLVAAIAVVAAAVEIPRYLRERVPKLSEGGANITAEYMPFEDGTLAARLPYAASLKIEEDLPVIDGATALYPIYSAFAQATFSERAYRDRLDTVVCSRTAGAYEALIGGEADVIFVLAPSAEQRAAAEAAGVELEMTPIAREAFVFFVNSKNPIDGLTVEQVQKIYTGEITNWSEVGGSDESIRAFQREEGSGSQSALLRLMEGKKLMGAPKEDVVIGMGGIIERTADYRNYKNAIGFSFRFYASEMVKNDEIKLLSINGVYPTEDNIRNGTYPLISDIYAVTAGTDNENAKKLVDWAVSDEGQELVRLSGYTPASGE